MNKKSIMWQYILEEPKVLTRVMESEKIRQYAVKIGKKLDSIYFVAHGSSYNAAVAVSDFMMKYSGIRVYVYTPANFMYNTSAVWKEERDKTLVAAISQTGTSSGVIDALRLARERGIATLGITDAAESILTKEVDDVLFLACAGEKSNAKTKGYSATLVLLLMLALGIGREKGNIEDAFEKEVMRELQKQISEIPQTVERICNWCEKNIAAKKLKELYVLGYGMNFGTALEGQLKLMETMCIPTMFNDIVEFSHGMHRAIRKDSAIFLLQTDHPLKKLTEETFAYLERVSDLVVMLDAGSVPEEGKNRLCLSHYPLTQSILVLTLAMQVFAVWIPEREGKDPNRDAHNDFTEIVHTRM